jgi:hypothetical protein
LGSTGIMKEGLTAPKMAESALALLGKQFTRSSLD